MYSSLASRRLLHCLLILALCQLPLNATADVWWPGWKRGGWAFVENIKKPMVWAPAAAALVFAQTNADQAVSDWASDTTPIFGSNENADDWSNEFKTLSMVGALGTALAVPKNQNTGKIKRMLMVPLTWVVQDSGVRVLKETVNRERPNGAGNSFPSGHTAEAFSNFTLASRNMHAIPVSHTAKVWADVGFYTSASMTGWARIEANKHWPSDVLFAAAWGNFFASFLYDWFIEDPEQNAVSISVSPADNRGMIVNLDYAF